MMLPAPLLSLESDIMASLAGKDFPSIGPAVAIGAAPAPHCSIRQTFCQQDQRTTGIV